MPKGNLAKPTGVTFSSLFDISERSHAIFVLAHPNIVQEHLYNLKLVRNSRGRLINHNGDFRLPGHRPVHLKGLPIDSNNHIDLGPVPPSRWPYWHHQLPLMHDTYQIRRPTVIEPQLPQCCIRPHLHGGCYTCISEQPYDAALGRSFDARAPTAPGALVCTD